MSHPNGVLHGSDDGAVNAAYFQRNSICQGRGYLIGLRELNIIGLGYCLEAVDAHGLGNAFHIDADDILHFNDIANVFKGGLADQKPPLQLRRTVSGR